MTRTASIDVERWLLDEIVACTGTEPSRGYRDMTFAELGLDSADAVQLSGRLAGFLGRDLSESMLFDHPTIGDLMHALERAEPEPAVALARAAERREREPCALVGLALRLPRANDLDALWTLASSDDDAVDAPPDERFRVADERERHLLRGAYLDDVEAFDGLLFGISPREASAMDPGHRLLLELTWEAIERAGTTLSELRAAQTGVFVGASSHDHSVRGAMALTEIDRYAAAGRAGSMAANRISNALGLTGPSMTLDTACSSALVALHLARRSLQGGECEIAIVGGVNLILWPQTTIAFARSGLLSEQGRCLPFDARADGFVRGEGAAVVVLRTAAAAEGRGDEPLALLRGSAVNSNGRTNGIGASKLAAHVDLLEQAYAHAGVDPSSIDYVEAQAPGSPVADQIEALALGEVLGRDRPLDHLCRLGSVKRKIGHLEAASGLAGVAHTLACARREAVPAPSDFHPSAAIPFDMLPVEVPSGPSPWRRDGRSRYAGVTASGLGGTNAHAVLELP